MIARKKCRVVIRAMIRELSVTGDQLHGYRVQKWRYSVWLKILLRTVLKPAGSLTSPGWQEPHFDLEFRATLFFHLRRQNLPAWPAETLHAGTFFLVVPNWTQ